MNIQKIFSFFVIGSIFFTVTIQAKELMLKDREEIKNSIDNIINNDNAMSEMYGKFKQSNINASFIPFKDFKNAVKNDLGTFFMTGDFSWGNYAKSTGRSTGTGMCPIPTPPYEESCTSSSCNSMIKCVMKKQKDSLKARLNDLLKTIEENTQQTEHQTKIIEKEVFMYKALLERIKKETLSLKEGVFLSKKIRDTESLGMTINTLEKGKK